MPASYRDIAGPQTAAQVFGAGVAKPTCSELEVEVISLFDENRVRLLSYVRAFGLSGHDGEEIVQEVFLSLFRHLQLGKSRRNLRSWLFRVAHNLALKRRQANQRCYPWSSQRGEAQETADVPESLDPAPNPEQQVLLTQRQQRLLSVVDALGEQDQLCFRLRAEGLRYREIAHVLGMSLGSVSQSLTRSLARLMRADGM